MMCLWSDCLRNGEQKFTKSSKCQSASYLKIALQVKDTQVKVSKALTKQSMWFNHELCNRFKELIQKTMIPDSDAKEETKER